MDLKKANDGLAAFRRDADVAGKKAEEDVAVLRSELVQARTDEQTAVAQSTRVGQQCSDVQQLLEDEQQTKDALAMALKKANEDLVTFRGDGDTAEEKEADNEAALPSDLAHMHTRMSRRRWCSRRV
eukprot:jgi/Undpi1/13390/HiC_scaffold_8.g03049.m1